MAQQKLTLKKGQTAQDLLDTIEAGTIKYMMTKRGIDEQAMRKLIDKDEETRASYRRKNARAVSAIIGAGMPAKVFGK